MGRKLLWIGGVLAVVIFLATLVVKVQYNWYTGLQDSQRSYLWVKDGQVQENINVRRVSKNEFWHYMFGQVKAEQFTESHEMLPATATGVRECSKGMKLEDWGGISIMDSHQVSAFKDCLRQYPPPSPTVFYSNTVKLELPPPLPNCESNDEECQFRHQQILTCWNRAHASSDWVEPSETRGITCHGVKL